MIEKFIYFVLVIRINSTWRIESVRNCICEKSVIKIENPELYMCVYIHMYLLRVRYVKRVR